jgi:hypothetical protein
VSDLSGLSAADLEAELARRRTAETAAVAPVKSGGMTGLQRMILILGLIGVAIYVVPQLNLGGAVDHSTSIATAIGASSCSASSFEVTSKLDGSKARIYDCVMNDGTEKCVTREGGINQDRTAIVRLLFQSTLSGGRPSCAA